ncbi:SL9A9 protein, partial [Polypterus senegalus]
MANAAEHHHQRETAELLVFNLLLILTFLTVWLFKHRRFRFLHETGGAMFYGLLMGLILCYSTFQPDTESRAVYRCLNLNSSLNSLMVNISGQVYQYQYTREISRNNIHGNHGNEMLQKVYVLTVHLFRLSI